MDILPVFDGNAAFIWACYGVGFGMIALTGLYVWARARGAKAALKRMEREA